jgi:hypothetical protein
MTRRCADTITGDTETFAETIGDTLPGAVARSIAGAVAGAIPGATARSTARATATAGTTATTATLGGCVRDTEVFGEGESGERYRSEDSGDYYEIAKIHGCLLILMVSSPRCGRELFPFGQNSTSTFTRQCEVN